MAKTKPTGKSFSFSEVGDLIKDMAKTIPIIIADKNEDRDQEFLDTGIYILNAALSGSLFGGLQSNRISTLAAPSGCLFPTEKINIYVMKTKNKRHNVYEEQSDNSFQENI
jgi:hypothetical protein